MSDLPNEIYLVPKNKKMVWSEIPSPYPGAKEEDAVKYYHSSVVDELKAQVEQLQAEVRIPQTSDEAAAMVLMGMQWLEVNDKERLTDTHNTHLAEIKAQAGRDGFIAGCNHADKAMRGMWSQNDLKNHADLYANQLRQGESK